MSEGRPVILVVDDEPHITHVVALKLRHAGYDVVTAGDGEEGFEIACETDPTLIITDLQMPYMTGLEMCRKLADAAVTAYEQLNLDLLRVLGPDHATTLLARNNHANWISEAGHRDDATTLYRTLINDCTRVLGPDHPYTNLVRRNLAAHEPKP